MRDQLISGCSFNRFQVVPAVQVRKWDGDRGHFQEPRQLLEGVGQRVAFADLQASDPAAAQRSLQAALAASAPETVR